MIPLILIVDDEESIRYTFECFLKGEGYNVVVASTCEEAEEKLLQNSFDLIFTDIILGKKTGIDLLRIIKEKNIPCPVIMVTGYPNIETASEAVRLGAFDYISKPVNQDGLVRIAKKALEHKFITDEKERYKTNLQAIFRSVKDGIITVDKNFNIIDINEAAKKICGLSEASINKPFQFLIEKCACTECLKSLKKAIEEKKSLEIKRLECMTERREGQIVSLSLNPLITEHQEFSGAVMVVKDETELVNLEISLKERHEFHNIIGKNEEMQKIYSLIESLADVPTTVLITGESGTGKELIAEALHYRGNRKYKPVVKVNCSALTESLLESELFGHIKGAFTGAIKDKKGRFQMADGGTIFLDEIGDISPALQLRLLRVLQEKEFEQVGDVRPIKVDVRIIAATNQNLQARVQAKLFREDLYYRLKVVEIKIPPLRERKDDIPILIKYFINKYNKKLNRNITDISRDVQKLLIEYNWPGNVRELEHVIEHAFILCNKSIITIKELPGDLKKTMLQKEPFVNQESEKEIIIDALKKSAGNKAKAARLIGISRRTIYRKIEEYNIKDNM